MLTDVSETHHCLPRTSLRRMFAVSGVAGRPLLSHPHAGLHGTDHHPLNVLLQDVPRGHVDQDIHHLCHLPEVTGRDGRVKEGFHIRINCESEVRGCSEDQ